MARYRGQREVEATRGMGSMWADILRRDPARALQMVSRQRGSKGGGTPTWAAQRTNQMDQALARIAYDYQNLGGLSPETAAMLGGMDAGHFVGDRENEQDLRGMATNAAIRAIQGGLAGIPTITGGLSPDTVVQLSQQPGNLAGEDYTTAWLMNQMLPYLGQTEARATRQQLARADPFLFRAYTLMQQPTGLAAVAEELDPQLHAARLQQAAAAINPETALGRMGMSGAEDQMAARAPISWLRNYLTTAASGLGGSRMQQRQTAASLQQLESEAEANRSLGGLSGLARSLVNPTVQRARPGLIGQGNALSRPPGQRFRNVGIL